MTLLADEVFMDPARLNEDYDARATVGVDGFAKEMARYRSQSEKMKLAYGLHFDITYCQKSGQALDIYGPTVNGNGPLLPVFLFIHGGYWRALSKEDSAMMAATLAANGIATVVIDYPLAPAAGIGDIVHAVRSAVAFIWRRGHEFGLDPQRISLGGSSAGGHLLATLLAPGWHAAFGVPTDVVKFAFPISGLFELAPLMKTPVQAWLALSDTSVADYSPMRHIPAPGCPITVAWAEGDPPGFKRQSEAFAALYKAAGAETDLLEVPHCNHFDVLMEWADPTSLLSRTLISGIFRNL